MSPTLGKIKAGHRAKNNGAGFENIFQAMCARCGVGVTRVPDGCITRRRGNGIIVLRTKSPWDWVTSWNGKVALLDTKTCGARFGNSAIDLFQVGEMLKHRPHATAGYVIWQRDIDAVFFVDSRVLAGRIGVRGSINPLVDVPQRDRLGTVNGFDLRRLFT